MQIIAQLKTNWKIKLVSDVQLTCHLEVSDFWMIQISSLPSKNVRVWTDVLSYTHRQHVDACLVEMLILICDFHIVSHQCSFSLLETGTKFEYLFCSLIIDTLHTFSCFFFYSFHLFVFSLCIEIFTLRSLINASLPSCLFLSHTPAVFLSQGGMFGERQASLPVMDSYNG